MKVTSPNSHILGVLFVFEFTSLAYGDGKGNAIGPGQNVVEIYHLLLFWRDFFKEQTIKAEEPLCVCVLPSSLHSFCKFSFDLVCFPFLVVYLVFSSLA